MKVKITYTPEHEHATAATLAALNAHYQPKERTRP